MRKAISPCSSSGRSCSISPSAMPGLLPDDANARARAIAWMFAALNTVEPPIVERSMATIVERDKPWYAERLPMLEDRVRGPARRAFQPARRCRLARRRVQRRRPDDGDGAAPAGRIGPAGGISEPRRLRRPRRSAARLPAGFRRSAGGFHGELRRPGDGACPAVGQSSIGSPCVATMVSCLCEVPMSLFEENASKGFAGYGS